MTSDKTGCVQNFKSWFDLLNLIWNDDEAIFFVEPAWSEEDSVDSAESWHCDEHRNQECEISVHPLGKSLENKSY